LELNITFKTLLRSQEYLKHESPSRYNKYSKNDFILKYCLIFKYEERTLAQICMDADSKVDLKAMVVQSFNTKWWRSQNKNSKVETDFVKKIKNLFVSRSVNIRLINSSDLFKETKLPYDVSFDS
jgi:hypothetical protein